VKKNTQLMETNWIIIGIVVILGLALIILMILKDQKEKRKLVKKINEEADIVIENERNKEVE
jgi:hypothetical protein